MKYRKFIFVCSGDDCKGKGAKKLHEDLKDTMHEPSYRGEYKIIKTKCMDFCKSAPVVIFNNEVIKKANIMQIQQKL
jgi:NADH:ubiquinone oxidoreductase subunit E